LLKVASDVSDAFGRLIAGGVPAGWRRTVLRLRRGEFRLATMLKVSAAAV
jgi:hypothetical protein